MGLFDFFRKGNKENETKQYFSSPKTCISDFFSVDINNLYSYNPVLINKEISFTGNEVEYYSLRLKQLELNLFYEIEIVKVASNECNITFKGKSNIVSEELKQFISFYVKEHGLDNSGDGEITNNDILSAQSHRFSRMWNNLFVDNIAKDTIELSIFGVTFKKEDAQ